MTTDTSPANDCQSDDADTIQAPPAPDWEKVARYYQNRVKNLRVGLEYKSFVLDLTVRAMGLLENKNKDLAMCVSVLERDNKSLQEAAEFNRAHNQTIVATNWTLLREKNKLTQENEKLKNQLAAKEEQVKEWHGAYQKQYANWCTRSAELEELKKELRQSVLTWKKKFEDSEDRRESLAKLYVNQSKENTELKAELETLKAQQKKAAQDLMKALSMYGEP
jgi:chromosome segregation ATPase